MHRDEGEKQFSRGNEIVLGNIVIPNSSDRIPNSIFYTFYLLHIQDKVYRYFSGIRISINGATEISIIVSLTTL